jgi:hypothetical protein
MGARRTAELAPTDKLEKIRAAYPNLPALSVHAQKRLADLLQSPTAPTPDVIGGTRDQLWKTLEKQLIYVAGKQDPINRQEMEGRFQKDVQALDAWITAAANVGYWADPAARKYVAARVADANDPASARTRERLAKPIQANFTGTGLADVIDFIRETAGVDILVDWKGLEAGGIPRDVPVELRLREPTAADHVFDLVLRTAAPNQLTYTLDRGVIMVGTAEQGQTTMVTKAYDVSDLVNQPIPAAPTGAPVPGAYGGAGMAVDGTQLTQLQALIMQTVQPNSWSTGGGQGTIGAFGTKLIIKNSDIAHKEVGELLSMLRDKPARKATEKAEKHEQ